MLGESVSMLVPQVVGFRLTGSLREGATATDLVLTVTPDPPPDRRCREVRRVLRRGRLQPAARRPGDDREHVAGVRRDVRLLPRRRGHARVPPADRTPGAGESRSSRPTARRICSGTTPSTSRPTRRSWSSISATSSPVSPARGARRTACRSPRPSAPSSAALETFGVDYGNQHDAAVAESFPASDPAAEQHAGPRPGRRLPSRSPCRRRSSPSARSRTGRAGRGAVRPRARSRRDRGDHELHEHVEPERDGRRRTRREERRRARAPAEAVGQVEPRARLEGRHRVLRARRPDEHLEELGFHTVGYGCTTCIGNSGPLPEPISQGGLGRRARRLLGAVGQPELRGADPSRGEGELPRLSPARRRLRARGADGLDLTTEPLGQGDGEDVFLSDIWPSTDEIAETVRSRPGRHVPADVRRRLQGRRPLELARDPRGRPLRLARGLDLRPAPAVLRRHVARAGHGRGHPRRPLPRSGRRLGHDRPHLAGRRDQAGRPRREVPDRARGRAQGLQLLRVAARQPRGDGARNVRKRPAQEPARPGQRGHVDGMSRAARR